MEKIAGFPLSSMPLCKAILGLSARPELGTEKGTRQDSILAAEGPQAKNKAAYIAFCSQALGQSCSGTAC